MAVLLFWIVFFVLVYTYFGYPLLLRSLRFLRPVVRLNTNPAFFPTVSIVVAAYNEESVIAKKVDNSLSLDYPKERLDIWIVSDGSTDNTNVIVKKMAEKNNRIHLLELPRKGKSGALNAIVPCLSANLVVFSDANTEFSLSALKEITKYFYDSRVGCVSGRLLYNNPTKVMSGEGEGFYWRYETGLKKLESGLGWVAGANGAIYAIRRELFTLLPPRTINDDFTISMKIIEKGRMCVYAEEAEAYEEVAPSLQSEFLRHVRDGAGHYLAIVHLWRLANPLLGIRSLIYWSHRLLRWFAPFFLVFVFILNLGIMISGHSFYGLIFMVQVVFYSLAFAGLFFIKKGNFPALFYAPFYFCNLNLALLYGFCLLLSGRQKTTWKSFRGVAR